MKGKRKFGFRNEDDERIILRRILLNTLMRGPVVAERIIASAARDYGFCREEVIAAAWWWNVIEEECDGQSWWRVSLLRSSHDRLRNACRSSPSPQIQEWSRGLFRYFPRQAASREIRRSRV
jgi:hypothetical protein